MLIQLYLKMFRLDLAQKQLKTMKSIDEDSVLTMLATAWVNMNTDGKYQDAVYVYEELIDKYSGSTTLLTGLAVCKMHLGLFEEAEAALMEGLSKVMSLSFFPWEYFLSNTTFLTVTK
jgi:coatomer protein complex subunit epsilon